MMHPSCAACHVGICVSPLHNCVATRCNVTMAQIRSVPKDQAMRQGPLIALAALLYVCPCEMSISGQ